MPKMKTHRGAAKRFTVTKSGRVKFKHAFMRHNLSARTKGNKRKLRQTGYLDATDVDRAVRMLRGE
jgi:large subunit ribosomal protein L35